MDRRDFFRRAVKKAGETVVEEVDRKVASKAIHWIRPPYALPELEFLLACTRCDACIEACPHGVLFPLEARLGIQVAGTPAMDLLNQACMLCEDWPCVKACEPLALGLPQVEDETSPPLPVLASVSIRTEDCLPYQGPECGACAHSCPVPGALNWDQVRPWIDLQHCVGCAQCRVACIVQPSAIDVQSLAP